MGARSLSLSIEKQHIMQDEIRSTFCLMGDAVEIVPTAETLLALGDAPELGVSVVTISHCPRVMHLLGLDTRNTHAYAWNNFLEATQRL